MHKLFFSNSDILHDRNIITCGAPNTFKCFYAIKKTGSMNAGFFNLFL